MISTVITAVISFVSTNIDDIFILMLFFSQINHAMKRQHIIIGQYLGIGILTSISIIGALGVSIIPHEYVGLLGLVPIYLGVEAFINRKKESTDNADEQTDIKENRFISFAKRFIHLSILKVTFVTIANGGDNIGIYIPLFASMGEVDLLITMIVFALLIALWCFIGIKLAEYPLVQKIIERSKDILVPVIFIGLGIFILVESETVTFILQKVLR